MCQLRPAVDAIARAAEVVVVAVARERHAQCVRAEGGEGVVGEVEQVEGRVEAQTVEQRHETAVADSGALTTVQHTHTHTGG